jgi:hypothetical protein
MALADIEPSGNASWQATPSLSGVVGVTVPGGGRSNCLATGADSEGLLGIFAFMADRTLY